MSIQKKPNGQGWVWCPSLQEEFARSCMDNHDPAVGPAEKSGQRSVTS